MATLLILGAGVAGHTAALHARRLLGAGHKVVVAAPNARWNWIPSTSWSGVGRMTHDKVTFPLAPFSRRNGTEFCHG